MNYLLDLFLLIIKKTKPRGHASLLKFGALIFKKLRAVTIEVNGFIIVLDLRYDCDIQMFINECLPHEKGLETILKKLVVRDDIFFDIGANLGYYSFLLRGLVHKSILFEPNLKLYENIQKSILTNVDQVNLEVFNIALGEIDTHLKLSVSDSEHNLGNFRDQSNSKGYIVPILNGDNFITRNFIESPTILKIDVEGFELNVLRGLTNSISTQKPIIFMEWSDIFASEVGFVFKDLESFFDQTKWMIYRIENNGSLRRFDLSKPKSTNDLVVVHTDNERFKEILSFVID